MSDITNMLATAHSSLSFLWFRDKNLRTESWTNSRASFQLFLGLLSRVIFCVVSNSYRTGKLSLIQQSCTISHSGGEPWPDEVLFSQEQQSDAVRRRTILQLCEPELKLLDLPTHSLQKGVWARRDLSTTPQWIVCSFLTSDLCEGGQDRKKILTWISKVALHNIPHSSVCFLRRIHLNLTHYARDCRWKPHAYLYKK